MCSNFGLNLHPGRAPAPVESHWYSVFLRLLAYLRSRFSLGAKGSAARDTTRGNLL